ncbi:MAG: hypothetical protein ACFBWO_01380 [Paracoccaceae bacterium]
MVIRTLPLAVLLLAVGAAAMAQDGPETAEPPQAAPRLPAPEHRFIVRLDDEATPESLGRAWALLDPSIQRASGEAGFLVVRFDGGLAAEELLALIEATRGVASATPDQQETLQVPAPEIDLAPSPPEKPDAEAASEGDEGTAPTEDEAASRGTGETAPDGPADVESAPAPESAGGATTQAEPEGADEATTSGQ